MRDYLRPEGSGPAPAIEPTLTAVPLMSLSRMRLVEEDIRCKLARTPAR